MISKEEAKKIAEQKEQELHKAERALKQEEQYITFNINKIILITEGTLILKQGFNIEKMMQVNYVS